MMSFMQRNGQGCLRTKALEAQMGSIPIAGRYHGQKRELEDDYVVTQSVLGSGFNGEVMMATSSSATQGQRFAVKSIKRNNGLNYLLQEQEPRLEVETHLALDHPHIVRVHDVYETKQQLHVVMECMEGGDLATKLEKNGKFSEFEASKAMFEMLLSLNYLHEQGITHRDVKLENYLYDTATNGHLKLSDFGFSNRCLPGSERMTDCVGTLAYTAPEVLKCLHGRNCSYTNQCDMWSLGVTGFVLLTDHQPFEGSDAVQKAAIIAGKYTMRPELWQHISTEGKHFIKSLLQVDPAKRLTAQQALEHPWVSQHRKATADSITMGVAQALQQFSLAPCFQRQCMQMVAWSLSTEELALVRNIFVAMDSEQCGSISYKALKQVMMDEMYADESQVRKTFDALDYNGDQRIHYSDFLAAMVGVYFDLTDELLSSTFRKLADSSHQKEQYITEKHLQALLGSTADIESAPEFKAGRMDFRGFSTYLLSFDLDGTTVGTGSSQGSRFSTRSPSKDTLECSPSKDTLCTRVEI